MAKIDMIEDQFKSMGVLKDSYINKHGHSPIIISLYNKTTGEKANLKVSKVTKSKVTSTCSNKIHEEFNNVNIIHKVMSSEDMVKEQTIMYLQNTQPSIMQPEIFTNNHLHPSRSMKTPLTARPILTKLNKGLTNNQSGDYETMLLKIIADLMTETEADLMKKHSGFCILNGLVVKSHVNIKDENIIVINSKLAKEGGVLLDIPAEMINLVKVNKDSKAECKLKTDEITADIILKPLTLIVGESIIKIRICNKVSGNRNIVHNKQMQTDLKADKHISTQTDNTMNVMSILPKISEIKIQSIRNNSDTSADNVISTHRIVNNSDGPIFVVQTNPDVSVNTNPLTKLKKKSNKIENSMNVISVLPKVLEINIESENNMNEINVASSSNLINKEDLKSYTNIEQASGDLSLNTIAGLKSNKKDSKPLKKNFEHVKYIQRLSNVINRIVNDKDESQVIDIWEKLIKLCKSQQFRSKIKQKAIWDDLSFKSICCSADANQFKIKNAHIISENGIENATKMIKNNGNIKDMFFHKVGPSNKAYTVSNIINEHEKKYSVNVYNENNLNHKKNGSISNLIMNNNLTNDIELNKINSFNKTKIKLSSKVATITKNHGVENKYNKLVKVKTAKNKKEFLNFPKNQRTIYCTRFKRNVSNKQNLKMKQYLTKEINTLKNKMRAYDLLLKNVTDEKQNKNVKELESYLQIDTNETVFNSKKNSISDNTHCKTHSSKTSHKTNGEETAIKLSEPLDKIKDKFIVFVTSQSTNLDYSSSSMGKTDSQLKLSDSSNLANEASNIQGSTFSVIRNKRKATIIEKDSDIFFYSKSENVKVACSKCGKMCELTVINEEGKLKLQLINHICVLNTSQIKQVKRQLHCSQHVQNKEILNRNENLFSQNINPHLNQSIETETSETNTTNIIEKLSLDSKCIEKPIHRYSENLKTFFETSSLSSNLLTNSDMIDYHFKYTDNTNSSKISMNSQKTNISAPSREENLVKKSIDNIKIECNQCGKSRTIMIGNVSGNTILQLQSHFCLLNKNNKSEDLEKLTKKMIPLNMSTMLLTGEKCNKNGGAELLKKMKNYVSRILDTSSNEICLHENKNVKHFIDTMKNYSNIMDNPDENDTNINPKYERTTRESITNQDALLDSNDLVNEFKNYMKINLKESSSCNISNHSDIGQSDEIESFTYQNYMDKNSTEENTSTENSTNKTVTNEEYELEYEKNQDNTNESRSYNQDDSLITNDIKDVNINNIEDKVLQKSLLNIITAYDREKFENTSSHDVFNYDIQKESEFYLNDNRNKTVKEDKNRNRLYMSSDKIEAINSEMSFKVLNSNEIIMEREHQNENVTKYIHNVEDEDSNVQLQLFKTEAVQSQIKLICNKDIKNLKINADFEFEYLNNNNKGFIFEEKYEGIVNTPVHGQQYKECSLNLKGKRKKRKIKNRFCVII